MEAFRSDGQLIVFKHSNTTCCNVLFSFLVPQFEVS